MASGMSELSADLNILSKLDDSQRNRAKTKNIRRFL